MFRAAVFAFLLALSTVGFAQSPTTQSTAFLTMFARSFMPGRSGQIMIVPREGEVITRDEPTARYMHGSPWTYDSAIPLFFAGPLIQPGVHAVPARQQDVAVTVARALG